MNTNMKTTRLIALSAVLATMGLASYGAAANSGAFPTSDPYSRDAQLALKAPDEAPFKPVATKEGEVMNFPLSGRSMVFRGGKWVSVFSKENQQAVNSAPVSGAKPSAAGNSDSVSTREGEVMHFPLSGRSAIFKNGRWVDLK